MVPIKRIISGGQTGADQAALRAARRLGLQTGGYAPRSYETLDGPAPQLSTYGLIAIAGGYSARTRLNVVNSDATVRFARNFFSNGERCTMRWIEKHRKPHLDIHLDLISDRGAALDFAQFLIDHSVVVLNVAGNSEQAAPGIGAVVENFLVSVLRPLL